MQETHHWYPAASNEGVLILSAFSCRLTTACRQCRVSTFLAGWHLRHAASLCDAHLCVPDEDVLVCVCSCWLRLDLGNAGSICTHTLVSPTGLHDSPVSKQLCL